MQLFGFAASVYVRSVRLALEEKRLAYELVEVDPFAAGGPPGWYRALHPFDRIPALRHGDFALFESDAILRYLEAEFPQRPLTPAAPQAVARMTQIMRIMDSYAYPAMVWTLFVMLARGHAQGRLAMADGMAQSRLVLDTLDRLMPADAAFLAGDAVTLADTHALPMMVYLAETEPGLAMLAETPRLSAWLERMRARPSAAATRSPMESGG